jgi:predicted nucleic acid-binding protein
MKRQIVILDANVLFPAPLRDFLMHLAITGVVQVRWSAQIEDEWVRNVLLQRPDLEPERIKNTAQKMNRAIPDAMVTGFETLESTLELPDPKDRHVLAAAIFAKAEVIVTKNLRDFPRNVLSKYSLEALHPDEFVHHLLQLAPQFVIRAVREQQQGLKNPPRTISQVLDTLENQGMPLTVAWLRDALDEDWKPGLSA